MRYKYIRNSILLILPFMLAACSKSIFEPDVDKAVAVANKYLETEYLKNDFNATREMFDRRTVRMTRENDFKKYAEGLQKTFGPLAEFKADSYWISENRHFVDIFYRGFHNNCTSYHMVIVLCGQTGYEIYKAEYWGFPFFKNNPINFEKNIVVKSSDIYISTSIARLAAYTEEYEIAALQNEVAQLLNDGQFDRLEKMAQEFRAKKSRTISGWWKLQLFYNMLTMPGIKTTDDEYAKHIARLENWKNQKPNSSTALIALGTAYTDYAWLARDNGWASTVTKEGWEQFENRLKIAHNYLLEAKKMHAKDPYLYFCLITVGLGSRWDRKKVETFMNEGIRIEPDYFHLYNNMSYYLTPRWHGSEEEWSQFADDVVKKTGKKELYARLAGSSVAQERSWLFKKGFITWQKVREGFIELDKAYPNSNRILNNFCVLACMAEDWQTAHTLFRRIGNNAAPQTWYADRIWTSQDDFLTKKLRAEREVYSKLATNKSVSLLIKDLKNPDRDVRYNAIMMLHARGPEARDAIPAIQALQTTDPDKEIRWRAPFALVKIARSDAVTVQALRITLRDPEPDNRNGAAKTLGTFGPGAGAPAIPELIKLLGDEFSEIRQMSSETLGKFGKTAMPELVEVIKGTDSVVRWPAARAMSHIGPDAIPALSELLKDPRTDVRCCAAWAIGTMAPAVNDGVPVLANALNDPDAEVRQDAAFALGMLGEKSISAATGLLKTAKDPDNNVRQSAIDALCMIYPNTNPDAIWLKAWLTKLFKIKIKG